MDRFFRVRVFLMFAVLNVAFALLAFVTSTRSVAETGKVPIEHISDPMPAYQLIGTSADPMDTMGSGAETPNGTSAPAFGADVAQIS